MTDTRSAIDKAFSLLRSFSAEDASGVGVSELARRADLSKSTAHRILAALVENDAVERSGNVYRLGTLCYDLVSNPEDEYHNTFSELLTPYLAALFEQTRHTVHLAYLYGNQVAYINKLFTTRRISSPSRIGGRAPAYCTGVGKAMLAWDQPRAKSVVESGLHPWTPYTITDPNEFWEELQRIRAEGFAYDNQEITLGLSCVAAPILGQNNVPVAALSVSGAYGVFRSSDFIGPLKRVSAAASKAVLAVQRSQSNG